MAALVLSKMDIWNTHSVDGMCLRCDFSAPFYQCIFL